MGQLGGGTIAPAAIAAASGSPVPINKGGHQFNSAAVNHSNSVSHHHQNYPVDLNESGINGKGEHYFAVNQSHNNTTI